MHFKMKAIFKIKYWVDRETDKRHFPVLTSSCVSMTYIKAIFLNLGTQLQVFAFNRVRRTSRNSCKILSHEIHENYVCLPVCVFAAKNGYYIFFSLWLCLQKYLVSSFVQAKCWIISWRKLLSWPCTSRPVKHKCFISMRLKKQPWPAQVFVAIFDRIFQVEVIPLPSFIKITGFLRNRRGKGNTANVSSKWEKDGTNTDWAGYRATWGWDSDRWTKQRDTWCLRVSCFPLTESQLRKHEAGEWCHTTEKGRKQLFVHMQVHNNSAWLTHCLMRCGGWLCSVSLLCCCRATWEDLCLTRAARVPVWGSKGQCLTQGFQDSRTGILSHTLPTLNSGRRCFSLARLRV